MASQRERWIPVDGYEFRYEVSSLGRLRRVNTQEGTHAGRVICGGIGAGGHRKVDLWRDSFRTSKRLCDLVARAFKGQRKPGQFIHFRDGDPKNVAASNLVYRRKIRSLK